MRTAVELNESFLHKSQNNIRAGNDNTIPTKIIKISIGSDSAKSLSLAEFTKPRVKSKMKGVTRTVVTQTLTAYFR
ncbi:MAG: hypothetical protein ACTHK0_16765 [Ginsengibacter sp.]